jgi:hypothetical protein
MLQTTPRKQQPPLQHQPQGWELRTASQALAAPQTSTKRSGHACRTSPLIRSSLTYDVCLDIFQAATATPGVQLPVILLPLSQAPGADTPGIAATCAFTCVLAAATHRHGLSGKVQGCRQTIVASCHRLCYMQMAIFPWAPDIEWDRRLRLAMHDISHHMNPSQRQSSARIRHALDVQQIPSCVW